MSRSADFDHLGAIRYWCVDHGNELLGVRERIKALLAQIEGLNRVLASQENHVASAPCKMCELQNIVQAALREQGALLIQLIQRERELTGAAEASCLR